jgi:hypothetical protein
MMCDINSGNNILQNDLLIINRIIGDIGLKRFKKITIDSGGLLEFDSFEIYKKVFKNTELEIKNGGELKCNLKYGSLSFGGS